MKLLLLNASVRRSIRLYRLFKTGITFNNLRRNLYENRHCKLVCFSPTGTTRKIATAIANGINHNNVELIDITNPDARKEIIRTKENELLIVAVPVYMGRVPSVLTEWFTTINAKNTPAVCVVVYGNRAFDDALLELNDMLAVQGCKPIAGAAFIGEHSFSSPELPSSVGRPDFNDLQLAETFGKNIEIALSSKKLINNAKRFSPPGNYPYGGTKNLWHLNFIKVSDKCNQCGICAKGCPVGAIDSNNSEVIDIDKCTLCCACIKYCPQNAKTMKPGYSHYSAWGNTRSGNLLSINKRRLTLFR